MKFALTFGQLNPRAWNDVAVAADELGFESLWLPEHLVLPVVMRGQLVPGEEHPPIPASTPVYDVGSYLGFLAARTRRIRLGTFVYLLAIRHPFVGARLFATLDVISDGRAECGIGVGWMTSEWEAVGLDPRTRGRRLDEAVTVTRRLWTEPVIAHDGEFWSFPDVMFEPKPVQPSIPIQVGGESEAALRRTARLGDDWLGMFHTPESAAPQVRRLRELEAEVGRTAPPAQATVMGAVRDDADVAAWEAAGVDRLIVTPWPDSRRALDAVTEFAGRFLPTA